MTVPDDFVVCDQIQEKHWERVDSDLLVWIGLDHLNFDDAVDKCLATGGKLYEPRKEEQSLAVAKMVMELTTNQKGRLLHLKSTILYNI